MKVLPARARYGSRLTNCFGLKTGSYSFASGLARLTFGKRIAIEHNQFADVSETSNCHLQISEWTVGWRRRLRDKTPFALIHIPKVLAEEYVLAVV